jgi:hypothetical protein
MSKVQSILDTLDEDVDPPVFVEPVPAANVELTQEEKDAKYNAVIPPSAQEVTMKTSLNDILPYIKNAEDEEKRLVDSLKGLEDEDDQIEVRAQIVIAKKHIAEMTSAYDDEKRKYLRMKKKRWVEAKKMMKDRDAKIADEQRRMTIERQQQDDFNDDDISSTVEDETNEVDSTPTAKKMSVPTASNNATKVPTKSSSSSSSRRRSRTRSRSRSRSRTPARRNSRHYSRDST